MRLSISQAIREVTALGDEAHYENTGRVLSVEAEAMIDEFDSVAERCSLRIAFFDGYDKAADRQVNYDSLGVPMELRA